MILKVLGCNVLMLGVGKNVFGGNWVLLFISGKYLR